MEQIVPAVAVSALSALPSLVSAIASGVATVMGAGYSVTVALTAHMLSATGAMFRLAIYPVSLTWSVIFLVLSPVIYTVGYALSPVWFFVGLAQKLQPLYIYFGSAAFIGILTGLVVKLMADLSVAILSLDKEDPTSDDRGFFQLARRGSTASTATSSQAHAQQQQSAQSSGAMAATATTKRERGEDDYFAGLGLPEIDWQVIDRIENRGPHSEHMRRMPLLQSIILEEEEDDSSAGDY